MGVCPGTPKKGGGGLRDGHIPKRGVLGAGTAPKKGVLFGLCPSLRPPLGTGQTRKKGGLRCGSGQKRGVFTAAHTYAEHICEYPPPGTLIHV